MKGRIGYRELYIDDAVKNINEKQQRSDTVLTLFDNQDEIVSLLDLSEDDSWFYNAVNSPYSDYEFFDFHSVNDDFRDGYGPWYAFSNDNMDLLQKIDSLISQEHVDLTEPDNRPNFVFKLEELFPKEVDDILYSYLREKNSEMGQVAREHIDNDIENTLKKYDFEINDLRQIKIRAVNLLSYFIQYNGPHMSLEELFKVIFENSGIEGRWSEDYYDYQNEKYFDHESFNSYVERELERILEKIEDRSETNGFKDFFDMVSRVTTKFKVKQYYDLPKSSKYKFMITGFDSEKGLINVKLLRKENNGVTNVKISEENFYNLLYQPTLFNLEDLY